jgi:glycolate oxidase
MDNWVVRRIEERIPLGIPLTADAILLFEMDGSPENVARETQAVIDLCEQFGAAEVRAAKDEAEANTFWTARRAGFSAVFSASPSVLAEDVTVPTNRIADQIVFTKKLCAKYGLTIPIIGHAGDGNLHPCILTDQNDAAHFALAHKAAGELFDNALALGGAISGEHGIGLEKQKYLKKAMSPDAIGLLKGIKSVFDPKGLLNPGKIWEPS